jgi:hypothetical protein
MSHWQPVIEGDGYSVCISFKYAFLVFRDNRKARMQLLVTSTDSKERQKAIYEDLGSFPDIHGFGKHTS